MALTLHYDFASDKSLAARAGPTLSLIRNTDATYVDNTGLIATASSNEARFTHDPVSNESLGLLSEEARTNLCLYSEDLSNAAWVASNVTKGGDSVTAPDGAANTAVRLTASDANGTVLQSITSASANRSYAVYIKRVTGTGDIDLTVDGGSTWTTVTLTASWQRFDIQQTSVTNPQVGVRIVTDTDAIDFWGAQLEVGDFPLSYIPTVGSTVTRNGDEASSSDMSFYNTDEGSVYTDSVTRFASSSAPPRQFEFSLTTSNYVRLDVQPGNDRARFAVRASASENAVSANSSVVSDTRAQIAGYYNVSGGIVAVSVDGATAVEDTLTGTAPNPNRLNVAAGRNGSSPLNGPIKELRYYDTQVTVAELESMSNGVFPVEDETFYLEVQRRQAANLGNRPAPFKPGRRGGLRDL